MGFFNNLFKSSSEKEKPDHDNEVEIMTREEKITRNKLENEGEANGWGKLITFYDYENYKEINNPGAFAVYEKCIVFADKYSGRIMIPRNSFISNKCATNVCRIDVVINNHHGFDWVDINLYTDTSQYSPYKQVNLPSQNMTIKKPYIDIHPQINTKIDKLMYWYYSIKAENPDNLKNYNQFRTTINSYRDSGFELISYPVDLSTLDAATYLWQFDKLVVLGKNKNTSELLIYKDVPWSERREPKYKELMQNMYILGQGEIKSSFVYREDQIKSFSVHGTRDSRIQYSSPNVQVKSEYSTTRAAIGYALAGPVGALALAKRNTKLPLGSYTIDVSDNRSVQIDTGGIGKTFLPYAFYNVLQKFYPDKEEVVFKQI